MTALIDRIDPEVRAAMLRHAEAECPRECCGLLVQAGDGGTLHYLPAGNLREGAAGEHAFRMDEAAWVTADMVGEVLAVVHSHPNASANPSMADRAQCERSMLPWLIVGWPSGALVELRPQGWLAPLEGREFTHGVLDCYTLVQDWYARTWGLELPDFDRADGWWEGPDAADLYLANFAAAGFVAVATDEPQVGDGLLMRVCSERVNHAAVYVGEGFMLHHLHSQLSRRERWDWPWQRRTVVVVRHVSRMGAEAVA